MFRSCMIGVWLALLFELGVAPNNALSAGEPSKPSDAAAKRNLIAGGPRLMLLRSEVVANDLKLTNEQRQSVEKIDKEAQEEWNRLRDLSAAERPARAGAAVARADAKIDGMLEKAQRARMREIELQLFGLLVLNHPTICDSLKLTDEQKRRLKELAGDRSKAIDGAVTNAGDRENLRQRMFTIIKDYSAKRESLLTPEQRSQFDKMQGKVLDLRSAVYGVPEK